MKKKFVFFAVFVLIINFYVLGNQEKSSTPVFFSSQIDLFDYASTDAPFDVSPHFGFGLDIRLTKKFSLGGYIFYSKWSDYLGMYCGKFNFKVIRPSLELSYSLPVVNKKTFHLLGGVGLSYNFIDIKNELGNECPLELENHFSISPFAGYYLYLIDKKSGLIKSSSISMRLFTKCYAILNGDFSGIQLMFGLGVGF